MKKPIGIGDVVEVKKAYYDAKSGRTAVEGWVPGSVTSVNEYSITVAYGDGTREAIVRGRNMFRRIKNEAMG